MTPDPDSSLPQHGEEAKTLSAREKVGYAMGDAGFVLFWHTWSQFLLIFYTDVFGITAVAVGVMFAVTRLFDAINDPLMGMIADQTKSRFGKFRPWLLWGILPIMILGVLLFHVPDLSPRGKLVYAYATYVGVGVVYTMMNIPYSALMGVMTTHSHERTMLASFRFYGAYASVFFVNLTLLKLVAYFGAGNDALGYERAMTVYSVVAGLLFLGVFLATRERIKPPPDQRVDLRADLSHLLQNGPWLAMATVGVTTLIWSTFRNGATLYYLKYHIQAGDNVISLFLAFGTAAVLIGVAFTGLVERYLGGKKRAYILLTLASSVLSCAFYFIDPSQVALLYGVHFLSQVIIGPQMPLYWSMIADTADYSEWKFGRRATGLIFSADTFSQKSGGALGGALAGLYLGLIGYVANQEQTATATEGLKVMMSFVPLGLGLLVVVATLFYPIGRQMSEQIQKDLGPRRP